VASRSRGGLVALLAGLLVAGVLWARAASHRGGTRLRVAPLVAGVLIVLAFGLAVVPHDTRAHLATIFRGRPDASGDYRLDVARDTLRLWTARPVLGAGLGAYADAFPAFKRAHGEVRTTHAEDDALEFVAETGLAGAAIAAWLVAFMIRGLGGRALPAVAALALLSLGVAAAWRAAGAVAFERSLRDGDPQMRVAALDPVLDRHPYLAEAYRARALAWRDLAIGHAGFAA